MKNVIKTILLTTSFTLLCLLFFAIISPTIIRHTIVSSQEKLKLAQIIEGADSLCPIPSALGNAEVTSIKLEDNDVTYYLTYKSGFRNLMSSLGSDQKVKETIIMCFLCDFD